VSGDQSTGRRVPLPPYVFDRKRCWLEPTGVPSPTESQTPARPVAASHDVTDIRGLLHQAIADAIDRPVEDVDEKTPLGQLGIDSLAAADVLLTMERELGRPLADALVAESATIESVAEAIAALPPVGQNPPVEV
jgi:acyl carrier protein